MVNARYDFILIWGNGQHCKRHIIRDIENHGGFEILNIFDRTVKDMPAFVKEVYSFDYAPFAHLKNKTRYLKKTPPQVTLILLKNTNPNEDYLGERAFRHIESLTLKALKEQLRDTYNERQSDRRTENHVIHASDNQAQTEHLLRCFGWKNGLQDLLKKSNPVLNSVYHLGEIRTFELEQIDINAIYVNILTEKGARPTPLAETPHYLSIVDQDGCYADYLQTYSGTQLTDYYSPEKFKKAQRRFQYLTGPYNDYIITRKQGGKYIVLDGAHRAAILKAQNKTSIIVAVTT